MAWAQRSGWHASHWRAVWWFGRALARIGSVAATLRMRSSTSGLVARRSLAVVLRGTATVSAHLVRAASALVQSRRATIALRVAAAATSLRARLSPASVTARGTGGVSIARRSSSDTSGARRAVATLSVRAVTMIVRAGG